ncbi:MAG TPA: hypothetical protein IAD39_11250 [Candidatus Merdisoma faecalis]|nr:hypothetical protein [Candidatus Merdisoma faecalis]
MSLGNDGYKILYDVQKKCNELNRKIDSIIRIMEMITTYIQYSNMMSEFQAGMQAGPSASENPDVSESPDAFSQSPPEGSEGMNPNDFQKLMNAARQSDHQMTQDEFNQLFEALKQGKSAEEVARMEQMVQLAKSFMK